MALYGAKGGGRGVYRLRAEDGRSHEARRTLELALRKALELGEFELYYQPVVNLDEEGVNSCEALIRWRAIPNAA